MQDGPQDFEMPETLSDETVVRISAWQAMKSYAMKDNFKTSPWYARGFNTKEQALVRALRKAQFETGDIKGPLEPVPNPLYGNDDGNEADLEDDEDDSPEAAGQEKEEDNEGPTLEEIEALRVKLQEPEESASEEEEKKEATFDDMLNELNDKQHLVEYLLENLAMYCTAARSKIDQDQELLKLGRSKMCLVSKNHSHDDEISGRLLFLESYASESSFQIKKAELRAIFDLLSKTGVKSDVDLFFSWCKEAYEDQKAKSPVIDLDEVGVFLVELMN